MGVLRLASRSSSICTLSSIKTLLQLSVKTISFSAGKAVLSPRKFMVSSRYEIMLLISFSYFAISSLESFFWACAPKAMPNNNKDSMAIFFMVDRI